MNECVVEVDAWAWYGAAEAFHVGQRNVLDGLRLAFRLSGDQFDAFVSGKRRLLPIPQPSYMSIAAVPNYFAMELFTIEADERRSAVFAVKANFLALQKIEDREAAYWDGMFGMSKEEFRARWDESYPEHPWEKEVALVLEVLCADAAGTPMQLPDPDAEEQQPCL